MLTYIYSTINIVRISATISRLLNYIENENYKGYDPYDTLNSFIPFHLLGKWGLVLAIQFQKRNPINIRPLNGIKKEFNAKAIGLLLNAYSLLYEKTGELHYKEKGYNFDWATLEKTVRSHHPNIVASSFVGKGIFAYYKATGNTDAPKILESVCNYILNDIPVTENKHGILNS